MNILVLAPHPFFQNRGTPIDVLLVLRVLAERKNTKVDLLVYNEGENVSLPNLRILRTPNMKLTQGMRPGFSFKKLICDIMMLILAFKLVHRNRYDLIHAGEEAVFIAILIKLFYRIPYAYDLDSSIAQQMVEQIPKLSIVGKVFNWIESSAIRNSLIAFPVCNALADLCKQAGAKKIVTLHDISQLKNPGQPPTGKIREETQIEGKILLYCGNLEPYQGVDLLLDSFAIAAERATDLHLVVIGGEPDDIRKYNDKAKEMGVRKRTHFLGPRPFEEIDAYLADANILVAPRIRGINTPMKVFPYLHSGKPVLLTDLPTHSQLLTQNEAYLAPPDPVGFAQGLVELSENKQLQLALGKNGQRFVEKNHSFKAHQGRLHSAYEWIEGQILRKPIIPQS